MTTQYIKVHHHHSYNTEHITTARTKQCSIKEHHHGNKPLPQHHCALLWQQIPLYISIGQQKGIYLVSNCTIEAITLIYKIRVLHHGNKEYNTTSNYIMRTTSAYLTTTTTQTCNITLHHHHGNKTSLYSITTTSLMCIAMATTQHCDYRNINMLIFLNSTQICMAQ